MREYKNRRRGMTEIMLKTGLNTIQPIYQSSADPR